VLEVAGLTLRELRPGIDAITLILRRLTGRTKWFDRYYEQVDRRERLLRRFRHRPNLQPPE
jgi:hypothetical protein